MTAIVTVSRRGFLRGLGFFAGAAVLEKAIPLGRVWSFPSKIVVWPGIAPGVLEWYAGLAALEAERIPLLGVPMMFGLRVPDQRDLSRTATGADLAFRSAVRIG